MGSGEENTDGEGELSEENDNMLGGGKEKDNMLGGGKETGELVGERNLLDTLKILVENQGASLEAVLKGAKRGGKRKKGGDSEDSDEEDDQGSSKPRLVSFRNHHVKDDAHSSLDGKVRANIRPFNGQH